VKGGVAAGVTRGFLCFSCAAGGEAGEVGEALLASILCCCPSSALLPTLAFQCSQARLKALDFFFPAPGLVCV